MKHTSLFVGLFMAAASAAAQPVLVNSNTSPVAGDKFYLHDCDPFSITEGASGAGVTWDYSTLSEMSLDSLEYGPCAGTPYCDSFPGSTVAINYGGGYYEYYVGDTSQFAQTGDGDTYSREYYPDPFALIKFPMGYDTTAIDTMMIYDRVYADYNYGVDTMKGDAYGTLKLPSGTYDNVLRVRMKLAITDSDLSSGPPAAVEHDTAVLYMWWTPGFHNPLLIMTVDMSGSAPVVQQVVYYTRPKPVRITTLAKNTATEASLNIFPNPVKDHIRVHFTTDDDLPVTIMLTDIAGRKTGEPVQYNTVHGLNELNYPVPSLPAGMYIMHIQTASGVITRKVEVAG